MDGGVPGSPRDNFEAEISKEEFDILSLLAVFSESPRAAASSFSLSRPVTT
jgi:hypothetical protein